MAAIQAKSRLLSDASEEAMWWLAITAVLCVLIAFVFLVRFPRGVVKPITMLKEGILEIEAEYEHGKNLRDEIALAFAESKCLIVGLKEENASLEDIFLELTAAEEKTPAELTAEAEQRNVSLNAAESPDDADEGTSAGEDALEVSAEDAITEAKAAGTEKEEHDESDL